MKIQLGIALLVGGCAVEPLDYGRCMASHFEPARTDLVPRMMDPVNPMPGGMVYRHTPARDVCDRWEFPEGRASKLETE